MKIKTHYVCQNCGHTAARWLGRCAGCESWNTLVEERIGGAEAAASSAGGAQASRVAALELAGVRGASAADWVSLEAAESEAQGAGSGGAIHGGHRRVTTGMSELDRVLGGGLVTDSFVLLGGDPGIGKSTLLLQMAQGLASGAAGLRVLYVSGEESVEQIRGRASRLGVKGDGRIFLAAETQLERVFANVKELQPQVIIMDSLQTFASGALESAPGSVSQLREVAARLMGLAKQAGIAIFLVGHVTKDGNIAGPKVVEHMVDTVLYFEAEASASFRLLRTVKNRFGSSRELGVFEMFGEGLREVPNPSSLFLSDRQEPVAGTAITASVEGSRPLLIELQALVAASTLAMPRRTSVGLEGTRLSLIAAILEKHMRLQISDHDLFFNVAGGLRLSEPACDLAAAAAIWSSREDQALPVDWVFIGELGLTGEVRRVSQMDARLEEAHKLGLKTAVVPRGVGADRGPKGMRIYCLSRIDELPRILTQREARRERDGQGRRPAITPQA